MELHPILAAVALVVQFHEGREIGTASGFFYRLAEERYFVTNKHVVAGEPGQPKPDELRLRLHLDAKNLTQNDWLSLPLYKKGAKVWKEHPTADIDVALVPLKDVDMGRFFVTWLQPSDHLPDRFVLHPGEDVFLLGYPRAFFDSQHNLPVFRNPFIASAYGVPFKGQPGFLTDARLQPGMSGSPVLTKPKNMWVDAQGNTSVMSGTTYFLLGVHSGTVM